jgi:hypothetical protein
MTWGTCVSGAVARHATDKPRGSASVIAGKMVVNRRAVGSATSNQRLGGGERLLFQGRSVP